MKKADTVQTMDETIKREKRAMINRGGGRVRPLKYRRFDSNIPTLFKEDVGNAGFDLFARLDEPVVIEPGEIGFVPLNVATEIPIGIVGFLFQRSSTFRKWGVRLTNGVGVIDASFRGDGDEWGAEFQNMTNETVTIKNGDKICQAVFIQVAPISPIEVPELGNSDRGGYGTSFDNAGDIENK